MSPSETPGETPRLSDHRALLFDVYGTLIDWESGIYDFLGPFFPGESREEVLMRYGNVEANLQMQYPTAKYSKVLEMAFRRMIHRSADTAEESNNINNLASTSEVTQDNLSSLTTTGGDDDAVRFGASIAAWKPFPDTVAALHKLKKYFALVVLSNVDDESFEKTHALLSSSAYDGGSAYPTVTPESPFSLILTAQRVGSYKPDPLMLRAALQQLGSHPNPSLPSNPAICVDKSHVLTIANSLRHDILPSMQEGLHNVWISRHGVSIIGTRGASLDDIQVTQDEGLASGRHPYTWRFEILGGLADAIEAEIGIHAV
ncbi:haloacid dehalogenase [Pisolithus croceorrhizus]|nr:haloacid dehalogenase [Pisolithus croceorrhizus]KAI6168479.1 haloacid dehalogenase [Pisolithus thermaeus]